jgi:hypothetical protein
MRALIVGTFALCACSRAVPPAPDAAPVEDLRESARETLGNNCGECHTRGLRTALPRALAVFDLDEPDWSRRMSADQLREAQRRLAEPTAPSLDENARREIHITPEERDRFARFVSGELARRDAR